MFKKPLCLPYLILEAFTVTVNGSVEPSLSPSSQENVVVCYAADTTTYQGNQNLVNVIIPLSVREIKEGAFEGCSNLVSVIVENPDIWVGKGAFKDCRSLTSFKILGGGYSRQNIREETFKNCTSLTSFPFPNSTTWIKEGAFENCTGLTAVKMPDALHVVESRVFKGCSNLTTLYMPFSVRWRSIEEDAFEGTKLNQIIWEKGRLYLPELGQFPRGIEHWQKTSSGRLERVLLEEEEEEEESVQETAENACESEGGHAQEKENAHDEAIVFGSPLFSEGGQVREKPDPCDEDENSFDEMSSSSEARSSDASKDDDEDRTDGGTSSDSDEWDPHKN